MVKKKSCASLSSLCVKVISATINPTTDHFHGRLPFETYDPVFQHMRHIENFGIGDGHFEHVLDPRMSQIDLSKPFISCDKCDTKAYIDCILNIIERKKASLTCIQMCQVNWKNDFARQTILTQQTTNLKVLILRGSNLNDDQMSNILYHCPQLETLDVSRCRDVTIVSLVLLGQACCPVLKELNMKGTGLIREDEASLVLRNCPQLTTLNWRNTANVVSTNYISPFEPFQWDNEDRLALEQLMCDPEYRTGCLSVAVKLCPKVSKVKLKDLFTFNYGELLCLNELENLKELYVTLGLYANNRAYVDYTTFFYNVLPYHCNNLTILTLGRIREVNLDHIFKNCPFLVSLTLLDNRSYTPHFISDSNQVGKYLETFKLKVREKDGEKAKREVKSSNLKIILKMPRLKKVHITGSEYINGAMLLEMINYPTVLQELDFISCPNISLAGQVIFFVKNPNLPFLSHLGIHLCKHFSKKDARIIQNIINTQPTWDFVFDHIN